MSASSKGTKAKPGNRVTQKSGLNRSILDASPFELVGCGGTDTRAARLRVVRPLPTNSNGLASRMERFSPDFWVTRFPALLSCLCSRHSCS